MPSIHRVVLAGASGPTFAFAGDAAPGVPGPDMPTDFIDHLEGVRWDMALSQGLYNILKESSTCALLSPAVISPYSIEPAEPLRVSSNPIWPKSQEFMGRFWQALGRQGGFFAGYCSEGKFNFRGERRLRLERFAPAPGPGVEGRDVVDMNIQGTEWGRPVPVVQFFYYKDVPTSANPQPEDATFKSHVVLSPRHGLSFFELQDAGRANQASATSAQQEKHRFDGNARKAPEMVLQDVSNWASFADGGGFRHIYTALTECHRLASSAGLAPANGEDMTVAKGGLPGYAYSFPESTLWRALAEGTQDWDLATAGPYVDPWCVKTSKAQRSQLSFRHQTRSVDGETTEHISKVQFLRESGGQVRARFLYFHGPLGEKTKKTALNKEATVDANGFFSW